MKAKDLSNLDLFDLAVRVVVPKNADEIPEIREEQLSKLVKDLRVSYLNDNGGTSMSGVQTMAELPRDLQQAAAFGYLVGVVCTLFAKENPEVLETIVSKAEASLAERHGLDDPGDFMQPLKQAPEPDHMAEVIKLFEALKKPTSEKEIQ